MKTISLFLLALAGAIALGRAQTNNVEVIRAPPITPPRNPDYAITYQTNVPYPRKVGEFQVTYGGVAADFNRGGARRLLAPASPTSPAYPFQNVSVNPRTGKAEGINIFSIDF